MNCCGTIPWATARFSYRETFPKLENCAFDPPLVPRPLGWRGSAGLVASGGSLGLRIVAPGIERFGVVVVPVAYDQRVSANVVVLLGLRIVAPGIERFDVVVPGGLRRCGFGVGVAPWVERIAFVAWVADDSGLRAVARVGEGFRLGVVGLAGDESGLGSVA